MSRTEQFWVIGVGASAGGLEALGDFLRKVPRTANACFIVAQHLAPHAKSMMVELISRQTELQVAALTDGHQLEAGFVYIVPPNYDAEIFAEGVRLTVAGEELRPKPSVDRLFASMAQIYRERSIGVILSGTGSDGAEGIERIKESGGTTVAQTEVSAKYDGMPRSAIETGKVDYILSAPEIGERLAEILESAIRNPLPDDSSQLFREILRTLRKEVGTDFSQYKAMTLQRRLAKRMSSLGIHSLEKYHNVFMESVEEQRRLGQELLVSVTAFFRDTEAFHAVRDILRKVISEKKSGEELRVWSAGCATGEEAYSLAMHIVDLISESEKQIHAKVFATDLDHDAIMHARNATYSEEDLGKVSEDLRRRHFEQKGEGFEVRKRVRDLVVFARQDLTRNPPFVKLDLISCRNVLIYFDSPLQKKIFEIFHYSLKHEGYLFLGKSESVGMAPTLFEAIDRKLKIFRRKDAGIRVIPSNLGTAGLNLSLGGTRRHQPAAMNIGEFAQQQLLQRHEISGVVVNEDGLIQAVFGDASRFLKVSRALTEFRLPNLLPQEISIETQVLLKKAARTQALQKGRSFQSSSESSEAKESYQILIGPLSSPGDSLEKSYLVSFEPVRTHAELLDSTLPISSSEMALRVAELEEELSVTREHLQTVIEELGVSNEELQSVNEELSSTNEELQASNEELETTNEEFQSTNEELTTLNEELNLKSSELNTLNLALGNIQDSIRSPLLVVDRNFRVTRYNATARDLFDISSAEIGSPITRISCRCEIPEFEKLLKETIQAGTLHERIIQSPRAVYQMRIMPCRTEAGEIEGATIIFFDNTLLIRTEERWRRSESRIRTIIDGSTSMIFLKDAMGRYLTANRQFLEFFGLVEEQVIQHTDREIFPEELANAFRDSDLEALLKRKKVERTEVIHHRGKDYHFLMSRFPLSDREEENPHAIGCVATDVTAQYQAQEDLHKSESLYRALVEEQAVFVARFLPSGEINFSNQAFRQYFGPLNPGATKDFLRCVDSSERSRVNQEIEGLTPRDPVAQVEHKAPGGGQTNRWIRWILKGLFDDAGKLSEAQAVGFDVTDYRHQTEQMMRREALFGQIFQHTSDQISVYRVESDGELSLESFNRGYERGDVGEVSYAQNVGKNLREMVVPSRQDEIVGLYQQCVRTREPQLFDEEISLQGGVKYFATSLIPVFSSEGPVERVVALSRDVSRFKRVELELKRAKDAAEIASEAKSDFLASMSHELRTPLNVVIGMSQLLEDANLKPDERRQVESIQKSGKLLLTLIEDVLDLSRIEAGKVKIEYTPFSLTNLVHEILENFDFQASTKNIRLQKSIEGIDPGESLVGDPTRIRQVLINLVGNAVKFTDQGVVSVKVSARPHKEGGRKVVRFEVQDTGIGIPVESHNRIFQKFSQVDSGLSRRYGGTGLGLVISRRLVSLMQGNIDFESVAGKGSLFWFELPLSMATEFKSKSEKSHRLNGGQDQKKSTARILAVDDSPESQIVLQMFLKRMGFSADFVDGGQAAIEKFKESEYDLILMDVQMPQMDGYQTTSAIRQLDSRGRTIPIVAVTANAMVGDSERCFEAGMNDYMTKPYEMDALRGMIDKWTEGRE